MNKVRSYLWVSMLVRVCQRLIVYSYPLSDIRVLCYPPEYPVSSLIVFVCFSLVQRSCFVHIEGAPHNIS